MSLLPSTSQVNPTTTFWGAKSVAGNTNAGGITTLAANTSTVLANYTSSKTGTYIITAFYQYNPQSATAGLFQGSMADGVASTNANCFFSTTGGSLGTCSCVLTIPNARGININAFGESSVASATVKFQWSIVCLPA
jgi:hypothetical protein